VIRGLGLVAIALFAVTTAARAAPERLLLTLSSDRVVIASNYAGAEITLFGAVRPEGAAAARPGPYDLIVTTRGPVETLTVREKGRVAGLWLNRDSRSFLKAPSYLSVLSNRPLEAVADAGLRARDELGLAATLAAPGRGSAEMAAGEAARFSAALRRVQTARDLWREDPEGVTFLDPALFRATLRLPPDTPLGDYQVEARLFSAGEPTARETIAFHVVKAGFEARVAELAETQRVAYAAATATLALLFGWLASVMFRRD
jgi:uncharacterized protein (TIGR02186 family)